MPDPLVAAAEAAVAEHEANGFDYLSVLDGHLIALRAALAARRQRDERAEAAVALCEAQDRLLATPLRMEVIKGSDDDARAAELARYDAADTAVAAARRRWAEVEGRSS